VPPVLGEDDVADDNDNGAGSEVKVLSGVKDGPLAEQRQGESLEGSRRRGGVTGGPCSAECSACFGRGRDAWQQHQSLREQKKHKTKDGVSKAADIYLLHHVTRNHVTYITPAILPVAGV